MAKKKAVFMTAELHCRVKVLADQFGVTHPQIIEAALDCCTVQQIHEALGNRYRRHLQSASGLEAADGA